MTDKTPDETPPDFAAFLVRTNKGRTVAELSERMAELILAVKETGKSGRIQLTVEVKPVPKTNGKQVYVTEAVAAKTPQLDRPTSVFFTDDDGALHRDMPQQHSIPFDQEQDTSR